MDVSELRERLQAIGRQVDQAPARPRRKPARRRQRAQNVAAGLERLHLTLDPELAAAKREHEERSQLERHSSGAMSAGEAGARYGMNAGAFNCGSCGTFKSEPAAVCSQCGDDPVSHNGDRHEYNRAHGYGA